MRKARHSVSDRDLHQYAQFADNLHQSRRQLNNTGGSLNTFSFPKKVNSYGNHNNNLRGIQEEEEEDDLYP